MKCSVKASKYRKSVEDKKKKKKKEQRIRTMNGKQ